MDLNNWEPDEIEIVERLCKAQFESFKRLYYEDNDENFKKWLRKMMKDAEFDEDDEEQYKKHLISQARKYLNVKKNPKKVFQIGDDGMSQLKHALSQFEDEWKEEHPVAVKMVWEKFFLYDKLKNFSNN